MASEMLYPVMPVYLKSIGYSVVVIGILEGVAEAVAGLSKGYFGKLSDAMGKRVPFVQWGYFLSAVSKPLMGFFTQIGVIFFSRTLDRLGKGIRTGARDALLSEEADPENKGKVFGFHRALDTLGAVLGPASALLYLYYNPNDYSTLFLIAFIPGLAAVLTSFALKENAKPVKNFSSPGFLSFIGYWKNSSSSYRSLVSALLVFALINSSDVFLLLMLKERGASDFEMIGIYIFYNLVYALFSYPLGAVADKIGLKKMLVFGLMIFSSVYTGMAFTTNSWMFLVLFAGYGIYAAATEGISKALITSVCDADEKATAIGTYTAFQSICALFASALAGWIWYSFGPTTVFIYPALISLVVALWMYFSNITPSKKSNN